MNEFTDPHNPNLDTRWK